MHPSVKVHCCQMILNLSSHDHEKQIRTAVSLSAPFITFRIYILIKRSHIRLLTGENEAAGRVLFEVTGSPSFWITEQTYADTR